MDQDGSPLISTAGNKPCSTRLRRASASVPSAFDWARTSVGRSKTNNRSLAVSCFIQTSVLWDLGLIFVVRLLVMIDTRIPLSIQSTKRGPETNCSNNCVPDGVEKRSTKFTLRSYGA